MIDRLHRGALSGVVRASAKAKRLAIRLTKWTGKSRDYVHPKHLLNDTQEHYWYLEYVRPDTAVLDVGCGNGMHTLKTARRCGQVAGVDADLDALGIGRRTARAEAAMNVRFVGSNVEEGLPLASARFDTVLCLDLLEHVHKRDLVLAEIRRVLKPSGVLLLGVPNRATSWKRRLQRAGLFAYSDPDHKIEYTLDELREELGRNGFAVQHLHPSVYDTPLTGLIDVVGGLSLPAYRRLTALRRRLAARWPEENAGFYVVCSIQ
jgi:ubiquinone/menaquinone biosynthesis C-methylase UbiE